MTATRITPPTMAPWNLALRFGLEMAGLTGLALAAWTLGSGPVRLAAVVLVPLAAAVVWAVFNVVEDPSRSGSAPVEVAGWIRLVVELGLLLAGAVAFAVAGHPRVGIVFAATVAGHYAASLPRLRWLLAT